MGFILVYVSSSQAKEEMGDSSIFVYFGNGLELSSRGRESKANSYKRTFKGDCL
jgi:hypothetical protein